MCIEIEKRVSRNFNDIITGINVVGKKLGAQN